MRCYVSSCINDSFRLDCGLTAKAKTEQVRLGGYGVEMVVGLMVSVGRWEGCDGVGERRKSVILGAIVHQVTLTLDLA